MPTVPPAFGTLLSPKQHLSLVRSTARQNWWTGAIRSGKTIASLLRWLQYVANEAPQSGVLFMVGQTRDTIERNLLEPLQDPAIFGALADYVHHTPGANVATVMGRRIVLVGAKDVKAFRIIRGATSAGVYVDEGTLLPPHFLTELLGRMSLKGAKLFGTTNPDGPAHWLKVEYLDRAAELGILHWTFTLDDNPSLDPEYVASIKREHSGLWYARLIEGRWVAAEGVVFDAWNPAKMLVDDLPEIDRWFSVGLDYGTTNPLDAVLIGRGTHQEPGDPGPVTRLYVGTEHRWDPRVEKRRLTDAEHSHRVQEWLQQANREDGTGDTGVRPDFVCIDPSAASFMEQMLADRVHGLTVADNSVLDGIRTVSSLMSTDRLRVHRSCKGLATELPSYSWDDKATQSGEDKPLKVADHACDALRYGIHTTEALWRPHIGRLIQHAAA